MSVGASGKTFFARLEPKSEGTRKRNAARSGARSHLGSAVLVEVEAGLLHPTDLREQLLRVASGEWRLGEGVFGQGSIRCSLERVSASVRRRKPRTTI